MISYKEAQLEAEQQNQSATKHLNDKEFTVDGVKVDIVEFFKADDTDCAEIAIICNLKVGRGILHNSSVEIKRIK